MTDTLFIGDYNHSSWSLRGWLLFKKFDLPFTPKMVPFENKDVAAQLAHLAPARTVPTLVTSDGAVIWDSLAIAEELAQRHPDAGIWPSDPKLRAIARNLACEMHSGFMALREECPMNLFVAYSDTAPSEPTRADIARIETLWTHALETSGGPWLCGAYSAVDAFYAPVAARIATYNLPVGPVAQRYVDAHLSDPAFRQWRALGFATGQELPWYKRDFAQTNWPGPKPRFARAVESGTSENETCPYSGKPVTHLLELDGRVFGVCNATCRAKTVADPEAWPAFMALV